jgi:HEAT repeat protein
MWSKRRSGRSHGQGPARAVPKLSQFKESAAFYNREYQEARSAIRALPATPWPKSQSEWDAVTALVSPIHERRVLATWGLIAAGAEGVPYALAMLRSRDPEEREDAAGILGALGRQDGVVAALTRAVEEETDVQAKDSAIAALGAMKNKEAIPVLAKIVRDVGADVDTRWTAMQALGKLARRRFDRADDPEASAVAWLDSHGY